jgi:biotin carboxylase
MERALSEFMLEGVPTNIETQKKILAHPTFRKGKFGTSLLADVLKEDKK